MIFHNWLFAWLIRPSMLLLVSSRMATCTSGFLVLNCGSPFTAMVARSDSAVASVNNLQMPAFIFSLLLILVGNESRFVGRRTGRNAPGILSVARWREKLEGE